MVWGADIFLIVSTILTCALGTMDVCISGSYGPNCKLPCGRNCAGSRCRSRRMLGTFFCTDGCSYGWRGPTCDRKCHRGCASCDQFTGSCGKCLEGWCGQDCQDACTTQGPSVGNCRDSSCKKCLDGWYSSNCSRKCPANCVSGCNASSGQCNHGCVQGYHGMTCRRRCTTTCMDGCAQEDGSCIGGCLMGWHGTFCNQSCGKMCLNAVCYQASGACSLDDLGVGFLFSNCKVVTVSGDVYRNCTAGCQHGWRGEMCDKKCPDECYSCPQYPDGRMCFFGNEVGVKHTYGDGYDDSGERKMRAIFAVLLVVPPFLIVLLVHLIRLWRDKCLNDRKKNIMDSSCESMPMNAISKVV